MSLTCSIPISTIMTATAKSIIIAQRVFREISLLLACEIDAVHTKARLGMITAKERFSESRDSPSILKSRLNMKFSVRDSWRPMEWKCNNMRLQALESYSSLVTSVAFPPNSTQVVLSSCDLDHTAKVYSDQRLIVDARRLFSLSHVRGFFYW
ncbi:uncharacterized protein RAG0_17270 [Rhynchosporium agropyri]|uniref:Uncharacterized protein n=1 Tax=Rhynchosporium agropyri TaxID=914238 RepID=A0A1E1LTH7_9HELO|nr:uncharacterized protein RAG0_17270 [Rhynchosporium agropyri]